jgi:outer membrane protein assembly factor BamE
MGYHVANINPQAEQMQKILITLTLISLMLTGCAHKIEIQQGNVVTQPQLEKLQTGMDHRQVRALLGSPLLSDPFHPDRWDYYYSSSQGPELLERYRLTLFFTGDNLTRFEQEGNFPSEEYQRPREK